MLGQERRARFDRRQGRGAALRKPPFLTRDGVVYADRRTRPDRRLIKPEVTILQNDPARGN